MDGWRERAGKVKGGGRKEQVKGEDGQEEQAVRTGEGRFREGTGGAARREGEGDLAVTNDRRQLKSISRSCRAGRGRGTSLAAHQDA